MGHDDHTTPARAPATPTAAVQPDAPGTQEGDVSAALFAPDARYQLGELLGRGGMGEVRLGVDLRIGREVAIKTLHQRVEAGSAPWRRFVREARVQGQLEHPAIVPVYDLDRDAQGGLFLAMRRVQGEALSDILERLAAHDPDTQARWSQRKLLNAFVQVCLAVDYAHSRGVVHRDLKPANIMLGDFGEVQLLDWGIARVVVDEAVPDGSLTPSPDLEPGLTREGALMGTPQYMPPEQLMGEHHRIGPAADVYALGLILFELLALRPYHAGRNMPQVCAATARGFDPRPSLVVPGIPAALDALCVDATRRDLSARIGSARALAEAIERHLDQESDRERRRALAADHAQRAVKLLDDPSTGASTEARREVMRASLQAMALDPDRRAGREPLVRLLSEVPATLPPEVAADLDANAHAARREGFRVGARAWLIWALTTPLLVYMGLRSPWTLAVPLLFCAVGGAMSLWLARLPQARGRRVALYALTFAAFMATLSGWLGPFVLVPTAASSILIFALVLSRPRERLPLIALSMGCVAVPAALEALGVLPPSYRFVSEGILLLPRALALRPGPTTFALLWSALTFIAAPALYLARMRDALGVAERRLALQAWQLRQLTEDNPAAPEPSVTAQPITPA
jgi:serine/threonine protein kinase